MPDQRYKVVFEGGILDGFQDERVKRNLAHLFKTTIDEIERFFWGKRLVLKKAVDYKTAIKYFKAFKRAGVLCRVEGLATDSSQQARPMLEKEVAKPIEQNVATCPRCQSEEVRAGHCVNCGMVINKFSERLHRWKKYALEKTNMKLMDKNARIESISIEPFIAEEETLMAEQFRKLRSVLNVHHLGNSLRSVLITSLAPEEGKTTISLNLAATVARGLDASVVLIDGDMRKKGLSILLGLADTPGLSGVLGGKRKVEEAVVQTEIDGLKILPAGTHALRHAELIVSARMRELIQELQNDHKITYVIIDSAPFLPTSDAHALSEMVDGILVVILADQTRRDVVRRELHAINKDKILGVVLNNAEFETSHHYHKYYKSYYGEKTQ
jgi:capsular exopolysaccharide synthesis family protein